ncbi:MAG: isoprenylcysteine carboxylmethyltransferase family protein [Pirellulaceae bacterium]
MSATLKWSVLAVGALLHTGLLALTAIMLPSAVLSEPYWVAFVVIVVLGSTAEAAMTNHVDHSQRGPCLVLSVAQTVGILIVAGFFFAHVERHFTTQGFQYLQPAGIALLAIGFGLRLWAIATLGCDFQTAITTPQTIAIDGPYRWMKHPGETGMVALAVGGPLSLGSIATASAILLLLAPIAAWRMNLENRLLTKLKGELTH